MENTLKTKFKQLFKHYKITQKEFANRIGVTTVSVSRWMQDDRVIELNTSTLTSIFTEFPEVNPSWFLLGKGEMITPASKYDLALLQTDVTYCKSLIKELEESHRKVAELQKYIDFAIQEAESSREIAKQAMNLLEKKS